MKLNIAVTVFALVLGTGVVRGGDAVQKAVMGVCNGPGPHAVP